MSGGSAGLAARLAAAAGKSENTPSSSLQSSQKASTTHLATSAPAVTTGAGAPKCPICSKSVYKMEEIVALNQTWHKACFTCGATQSDGCGRTLNREGYLDHSGAPYCNPCYGRLFRPKGVGFGTSMNTDATKPEAQPSAPQVGTNISQVDTTANRRPSLGGGSAALAARLSSTQLDSTPVSQAPVPPAPAPPAPAPPPPAPPTASAAAAVASKPTARPAAVAASTLAGAGAPKCPICSKSVYKMEEIVALNQTWHKACFTCGATQSDGCGRTLNREGYLDHSGAPYCNPCYGRLFRPKGVGFGTSMNTDTSTPSSSANRTGAATKYVSSYTAAPSQGGEVDESEW